MIYGSREVTFDRVVRVGETHHPSSDNCRGGDTIARTLDAVLHTRVL